MAHARPRIVRRAQVRVSKADVPTLARVRAFYRGAVGPGPLRREVVPYRAEPYRSWSLPFLTRVLLWERG